LFNRFIISIVQIIHGELDSAELTSAAALEDLMIKK
jgi:hypothetical protein